jgi:hypothetical protein
LQLLLSLPPQQRLLLPLLWLLRSGCSQASPAGLSYMHELSARAHSIVLHSCVPPPWGDILVAPRLAPTQVLVAKLDHAGSVPGPRPTCVGLVLGGHGRLEPELRQRTALALPVLHVLSGKCASPHTLPAGLLHMVHCKARGVMTAGTYSTPVTTLRYTNTASRRGSEYGHLAITAAGAAGQPHIHTLTYVS